MGDETAERLDEPTEEELEYFADLVAKAADLHEMTWCVKRGWVRWTRSLRGRECLSCPKHVLKGGVCDPL